MEAGRLTGEVVGERCGARERAEGRLGVEVERVPDADRGVLGWPGGRHGPRGVTAVLAVARTGGCDCRRGVGSEGSGEEGEEVHDDEDGVDGVGLRRGVCVE